MGGGRTISLPTYVRSPLLATLHRRLEGKLDKLHTEVYTENMIAPSDVYDTIRRAIVDGRLRPNQTLGEAWLARDMGVSRTPVREAFRRLHSEGLIERETGRASRVADLTPEDLTEVFSIRQALETVVLERACANPSKTGLEPLRDICSKASVAVENRDVLRLIDLNSAFHAGLVSLASSRRLESHLSRLRDQSRRYRVLALYDRDEQLQSVAEHKAFLDCIADGRVEDATALLATHLERPLKRMRPSLQAGALPGPVLEPAHEYSWMR